jgi:hypothetical protein
MQTKNYWNQNLASQHFEAGENAITHPHLNEVKSWGIPQAKPQPEPAITESKKAQPKPRESKAGENFRITLG